MLWQTWVQCSRSNLAVHLFVSSFKVALSVPIPASYVIGRFFCSKMLQNFYSTHFTKTFSRDCKKTGAGEFYITPRGKNVKNLGQENLRKRHGTNRWATLAKIGPAKIEFQSSFGCNNRAQFAGRSVGRSADPLHQNIKGGAAPFLGGFVPELIRKSDVFGEWNGGVGPRLFWTDLFLIWSKKLTFLANGKGGLGRAFFFGFVSELVPKSDVLCEGLKCLLYLFYDGFVSELYPFQQHLLSGVLLFENGAKFLFDPLHQNICSSM